MVWRFDYSFLNALTRRISLEAICLIQESQEKEIHLEDLNPDAFEIVLKYLYTKDLNFVNLKQVTGDVILEAFLLASEYDLEPLQKKLEQILILYISEKTIFHFLLLADVHRATVVSFNLCDDVSTLN